MKSKQSNKQAPKEPAKTTVESSANNTIPPIMSINEIIRFIFSNLAIFVAIFTIAGFFTIQSYLATFSDMFSYNISISQYIGAGISFIPGFIFYLIDNTIPNNLPLLIYMILAIVMPFGLYFIVKKWQYARITLFMAVIVSLFIYVLAGSRASTGLTN